MLFFQRLVERARQGRRPHLRARPERRLLDDQRLPVIAGRALIGDIARNDVDAALTGIHPAQSVR